MKRKILPYNPQLKLKTKKLRNNSTFAEVLLWNHLKGRKLKGYQFQRRKPIDNYIVDFYCCALMLAIEIDGYTHDDQCEYDVARQRVLEALGVTVLRFLDEDVKDTIDSVLYSIQEQMI